MIEIKDQCFQSSSSAMGSSKSKRLLRFSPSTHKLSSPAPSSSSQSIHPGSSSFTLLLAILLPLLLLPLLLLLLNLLLLLVPSFNLPLLLSIRTTSSPLSPSLSFCRKCCKTRTQKSMTWCSYMLTEPIPKEYLTNFLKQLYSSGLKFPSALSSTDCKDLSSGLVSGLTLNFISWLATSSNRRQVSVVTALTTVLYLLLSKLTGPPFSKKVYLTLFIPQPLSQQALAASRFQKYFVRSFLSLNLGTSLQTYSLNYLLAAEAFRAMNLRIAELYSSSLSLRTGSLSCLSFPSRPVWWVLWSYTSGFTFIWGFILFLLCSFRTSYLLGIGYRLSNRLLFLTKLFSITELLF